MNPEKSNWRKFRSYLKADQKRIETFLEKKFGFSPCLLILDPSFLSVWLYRLSRFFWCQGLPQPAALLRRLNIFATGLDVHGRSDIGPGLLVPAPNGVNLYGKIGKNLTILPLSGIGMDLKGRDIGAGKGAPILGNDITLHQFSSILGTLEIQAGAQLNPGTLVTFNVPEKSRLTAPCRYQPGQGFPPISEKKSPVRLCPHTSWKETREQLVRDREHYLEILLRSTASQNNWQSLLKSIFSNHFLAIVLYRVSHQLNRKGWKRTGNVVFWINCLINKVTLFPDSCVDSGLVLPHPTGVLFRGNAGENLHLYPNTVCSTNGFYPGASDSAGPELGDGVIVGSHSGIYGRLSIGAGTRLGIKTRATVATPANSLVFQRKEALGKVETLETESVEEEKESDAKPDTKELQDGKNHDLPGCISLLKKDLARLKERARIETPERSWFWFLFPSFFCVFFYRLSHAAWERGLKRLAYFFWWINYYVTGSDLAPSSKIGEGLFIPYPAGVSIHCNSGKNLTVMAQSGIGPFFRDGHLHKYWDQIPVLGDNVLVGHHCGIFGQVEIGSGVSLFPGCIIMEDIPEDTFCAAAMPEIRKWPSNR